METAKFAGKTCMVLPDVELNARLREMVDCLLSEGWVREKEEENSDGYILLRPVRNSEDYVRFGKLPNSGGYLSSCKVKTGINEVALLPLPYKLAFSDGKGPKEIIQM
jgi:hypothetical protein